MTGRIAHGLVICTVFAVTALVPRAGSAVLYVPLPGHTSGQIIASALQDGAEIAGSGPGGMIVMRNAPGQTVWSAFRSGALTIAVPENLCTKPGVGDG